MTSREETPRRRYDTICNHDVGQFILNIALDFIRCVLYLELHNNECISCMWHVDNNNEGVGFFR